MESKLSSELLFHFTRSLKNLAGIAYKMKEIKIIRHIVIAHLSNKIDSNEAFKKANLRYENFRDIIVELGNILNRVRIAYSKDMLGFWLKKRFDKPDKFIQGDMDRLLQDLINFNSNIKRR